jgi:hypothetical protein
MKQIAKVSQFFIASIILFLLSLIPVIASAEENSLGQVQKPIYCGDSTKLLNFLTKKHKESPVIIFNDENGMDSQVVVFVNVKNGTATVVENIPNGYSCILASGHDAMVVPIKDKPDT